MLEFNASVFGGEVPVCLGVIGIALLLPRGDFVGEGLFVGECGGRGIGCVGQQATEAGASRLRLR